MNETTPHLHAGRNGLPYAQLELSPKAVTRDGLESWLKGALRLLPLPDEFIDKVLTSICDAGSSVPGDTKCVLLLVYILALHSMVHQTWGFFQTVKRKEAPDDSTGSQYEIAVYLYVEGGPRESGSYAS